MSLQAFFNRLGNPILSALLRSPLHALLDGGTMLVTVAGRRSGRLYTTPVNYQQQGEMLTIISLRERTWWRNLRGGAELGVHLRGQVRRGRAALSEDDAAVAEGLKQVLTRLPAQARYLGVRMRPDGTPHPEDLAHAAHSRVVVRIQLT
jgi:deazaflavin-dependent oxidoreductase (nitroreductase family)